MEQPLALTKNSVDATRPAGLSPTLTPVERQQVQCARVLGTLAKAPSRGPAGREELRCVTLCPSAHLSFLLGLLLGCIGPGEVLMSLSFRLWTVEAGLAEACLELPRPSVP